MHRSWFVIAGLLAGSLAMAQPAPLEAERLAALEAYWAGIEAKFRDPATSPLPKEEQAGFHGLERFAPDAHYLVEARFKPKAGADFGMATTTDRRPVYRSMGQLHFKLHGRKLRLTVYQNRELARDPGHANYLFVPFTDLTNGEETYGGGRYLDLQGPLGKTVALDLNRAYNPYCAYGGRYSCPVPPAVNHLPVRVEAGVKAPAAH